jgi:hypothetical protein
VVTFTRDHQVIVVDFSYALIDGCDSGKYVLHFVRIQYVSALRSKSRSANQMLQTLSSKLNYYFETSRLLSVSIFQARRRIGQSVLTVNYRCKAATSRCIYRPSYWNAAWCNLELRCALHLLCDYKNQLTLRM